MIIIETGRGPVKDQFKFDNFFGILNIVNYSQHRCVASILSVDNLENNQLVMCQAQKVSTRSTFPIFPGSLVSPACLARQAAQD